jgi:hypothetical protein
LLSEAMEATILCHYAWRLAALAASVPAMELEAARTALRLERDAALKAVRGALQADHEVARRGRVPEEGRGAAGQIRASFRRGAAKLTRRVSIAARRKRAPLGRPRLRLVVHRRSMPATLEA